MTRRSGACLRCYLVVFAVVSALCVSGPALYWKFNKDCGGEDLEAKEEMGKQFVDLLTEELKLQEAVGEEHACHMNITLVEARRAASQYLKEAEKCNVATETCEQARERSEALLIKEKKMTSLWERRARQLGWGE